MKEAGYKQEEFNRYLTKIRIGNKSQKQKKTLANINEPFNGRNDVIKFGDDYISMILEAKEKLLKKNLNHNHQKQKLNSKNLH